MGGSSSGGGKFVERGTPLSQAYTQQRADNNAAKEAARHAARGEAGGGDNARGYEGGVVDGRTGVAIGMGILGTFGTAMLGMDPVTALTTGYQTYRSFSEETDPETGAKTKGLARSLADMFGSLLGEEDDSVGGATSGLGDSPDPGGFGQDSDGVGVGL